MAPSMTTVPPATIVIPPPPPKPVAAAPKPQTSSVDLLFEKATTLPQLVVSLVKQWDPGIAVPRGDNACRALRKQNLECYRTSGDLDDLRQMNRPAILTFTNPAGGMRYALLTRMDPGVLRFETPKGAVGVATDEVVKTWTGEMLLLWRRETKEVQLQPGMRGPSIVWLRERLIQMLGKKPEGQLSDRFDESLKGEVQEFQKARSMVADGTVGIRTRIALSDPVPGTPRLMDLP
jgi:general secretion pathway protein A